MATRRSQHLVSPRRKNLTPAQEVQEPSLRAYPIDSPQAAARVLALALLADGSLQLSEFSALGRRGTLARLGITEPDFNEVIDELCVDLLLDGAASASGYFVIGRDALRRIVGDIDDPAMQRKLLRGVLDIVHADGVLAGGEAVLLSVAAECWDIDPFDSYRILAKSNAPAPRQEFHGDHRGHQ